MKKSGVQLWRRLRITRPANPSPSNTAAVGSGTATVKRTLSTIGVKTFSVQAEADARGDIQETIESNNLSSLTYPGSPE